MYKDKNKQRKANRQAVKRHRERKGITLEGITSQGITRADGNAAPVIPNFGQSDCECRHCRANRANGNKHALNHGPYKPDHQLAKDEVNRVSLPVDVDYDGAAQVSLPAG